MSEQAQAIVGTDAPEDWELRPQIHARELPDAAAPLKRVLRRPDLEEIIDTFAVSGAVAKRAQQRYKLLMRLSALSSLGAMIIAAGLLLVYASVSESNLLPILSALQGGLLLLSFMFSLIVAYRRPFDVWMKERATAEHLRILLFNRIIAARETSYPEELSYLQLKLEYFRRYQLDVQRKYYRERGQQHRNAVVRASILRWLGTFMIVIAGAPVMLRHFFPDLHTLMFETGFLDWARDGDLQQRFLVAMSTTGAALQGFLVASNLINQDERNAARYASTSENLEALATRPLDEARAAAAAGDEQGVATFAALIQEQISSEHREWVSLRAVAPNLSLGQLRQVNLPWLK